MKQFLTVDELIQRIKEQNGAVIKPVNMRWFLRTGGFFCNAVCVEDIPRIMENMLQENLVTSVDMVDRKNRDVSTLHEVDAAIEMQRLTTWSGDLAAWVVESSTDESGQIVKHEIDAALGGETWVPGWMVHDGKRITLVSTAYRVEEI
jgi:hypothetical protein